MEEKINLDPTNKPPRKINRILLGGVTGLIILGIAYLSLPGSDSKPAETKNETQVSQVNLGSTLANSEEIARRNADNKSNKNAGQQGQNGANSNAIVQADNHDHSNALSTNQSGTISNGGSGQQVASAEAPAPLTPREKYEEEREARSWERQEKNSLVREAEDVQGQRSKIFFDLPKKDKEETNKSSGNNSNVNDYYNNSTDSNYITVVGKGRS